MEGLLVLPFELILIREHRYLAVRHLQGREGSTRETSCCSVMHRSARGPVGGWLYRLTLQEPQQQGSLTQFAQARESR